MVEYLNMIEYLKMVEYFIMVENDVIERQRKFPVLIKIVVFFV